MQDGTHQLSSAAASVHGGTWSSTPAIAGSQSNRTHSCTSSHSGLSAATASWTQTSYTCKISVDLDRTT